LYPAGQVQQLRVVAGVGAAVVGVAGLGTHAHLSLGSGNPISYQCTIPAGHVQQLRVVAGVGAAVVVGVDGALVVDDGFRTHAHLSVGSGNPKSYQCEYPAGQVQQLRVVAGVGAAVVVGVDGALVVVVVGLGTHAHLSLGSGNPRSYQCA